MIGQGDGSHRGESLDTIFALAAAGSRLTAFLIQPGHSR